MFPLYPHHTFCVNRRWDEIHPVLRPYVPLRERHLLVLNLRHHLDAANFYHFKNCQIGTLEEFTHFRIAFYGNSS